MNGHRPLPRVTHSNLRADFSGVHAEFDRRVGAFEREALGRERPNRIAGNDDARGEPYAVASPIDSTLEIGRYVAADRAAVDGAVRAAAAAFPAWSHEPAATRIAVLQAVATELEHRKWDLTIAALLEVGKSRMEALGEAEQAIDLLRYYAAEALAGDGWPARPMQRAAAREMTSDHLRPYGVFGVIAPFDHPVALPAGMLAAAILTGNTVVLKPSPGMGLTARLLVEACEAGGVPTGVVNHVCGGADVGRLLVEHAEVAGIAFAGSRRAGMEILRTCAAGRNPRPAIIEMGGKNPAYVTPSAELGVAAEGIVRSAFGLSGQQASALSRLFVHADVHDGLVDRVAARTRALAVGDPRRAGVFMGPLVDAHAKERYLAAIAEARAAGATLVCGGGVLGGEPLARGAYVEPTIVAGLAPEHRLSRDELFVPLLVVHRYTDLAAALDEGNAVDYGLSAGIYAWDRAELDLFFDRAAAGVLYANRASGATTGAWPGMQSVCGWKGSGASGRGASGPHYLLQFLREQSRTIMTE